MAPEPRPPHPIQPTFSLRLSGFPRVTVGKAIAAPAAAVALDHRSHRPVEHQDSGLDNVLQNRDTFVSGHHLCSTETACATGGISSGGLIPIT